MTEQNIVVVAGPKDWRRAAAFLVHVSQGDNAGAGEIVREAARQPGRDREIVALFAALGDVVLEAAPELRSPEAVAWLRQMVARMAVLEMQEEAEHG